MTVPLPVDGDTSWSDWAQFIHNRVAGEGAATDLSVRKLGSGSLEAAPGTHTHTASQVSDSSSVGRTVLTAADAAAARAALGTVDASVLECVVLWNTSTGWGAARPSGFRRVRWAANGATNTTDPAASIGVVGDIWERPA